jgi:hypothetical protein
VTGSNPIETLVNRTARGVVTRRGLIKRTSGTALASALGLAYLGSGDRAELAFAAGDHVCGPSPYCGQDHCYSDGHCHETSNRKPQAYGGGYCIGSQSNYVNCWPVCASGIKYRCCDCCVQANIGSGACSNCGSSGWDKCICRSDAGVLGGC